MKEPIYISKDSLSKSDKWIYTFVDKISNVTGKLSQNLVNATKELNYLKYKMLFGEKDSDIYIVTYPKSGTTIMQMMLYQLTTNGAMDFEHIYEKSPWIKNDVHLGFKPKKLPDPRLIKSHDTYDVFPKETKGKFIYIYRNGMDVLVSNYYQKKQYINPNLNFDEYFDTFMKEHPKNWFNNLLHWKENKQKLPVLYLRYDNIINNLEETAKTVAQFANIPITDNAINRVKERCSFKFMKQHDEKFGLLAQEAPFRKTSFLRKGVIGDYKNHLSKKQEEQFANILKEKGLFYLFY